MTDTPTPEAKAKAEDIVNTWCDYPGLADSIGPALDGIGAMGALENAIALALTEHARTVKRQTATPRIDDTVKTITHAIYVDGCALGRAAELIQKAFDEQARAVEQRTWAAAAQMMRKWADTDLSLDRLIDTMETRAAAQGGQP